MRLLLTWAPVVLAPFVALIAFLSIAQVRTQADEARQAQIGFSQLEAALNLERARDWRAVATGQIGEEVLTQRRDARTHIRTLLRTLEVVADDENVGLVAQEVRSYEAALDSVLGLGAGFLDPEALDAQVVAPAFLRLSERLGEINEEEAAEAAAAIRRATLGTGASLSVATLLLLLLFWRFHHDRRKLLEERTQELSAQALQDSLTGLPNRRKLMQDLERALETATSENPGQLVMFDLDGFKSYNDSFGHPEGDLLLRRLGGRFATAIEGRGTAYRLGGDEFCALIQEESAADDVIRDCREALAEQNEAFSVRTSFGAAFIPTEAATASEALRLADQRMYSHKGSGRLSAREQTRDLVLRILDEQQPILREHVREVASLARAVGERSDSIRAGWTTSSALRSSTISASSRSRTPSSRRTDRSTTRNGSLFVATP